MRKVKVLLFSVFVLFVLGASLKEVVSQSNPNLKERFYLLILKYFSGTSTSVIPKYPLPKTYVS